MKDVVAIAVATTLGLAGAAAAKTPTETVLYSFKGGRAGSAPYASLLRDRQGALFGTTVYSGPQACGTAFRLKPGKAGKPWGFLLLHVFTRNGDGCSPTGALVADPSGTLYGTTRSGGGGINGGTVFALTPPAAGGKDWTETIIYSFPVISSPSASLIRDASGVLFGTTSQGGDTDAGSVFALAPPTAGQTIWTESQLYSFQGGADGGGPSGSLLEDSTGALYGTTPSGGTVSQCMGNPGCGTVFRLTPPAVGQTAWAETTLYTFTGGTGGANPAAGLVFDKSGALYGTTVAGGDGDVGGGGGAGVVFRLTPPVGGQTSWTESVIHTFTLTDGAGPTDSLIMGASGALFGTTSVGGSGCCGTVFKLAPPAAGRSNWKETVIYNFQGGSDGGHPYGGLVMDSTRNLFGTTTTSEFGANGAGTVFEVTP
jgi:uncharacterized repeat protein (TIGR03803 family)